MEDRMIRLIWDFRGPDASQTAVHHEKHLTQFAEKEGVKHETGCEKQTDQHHIAWIAVEEKNMILVRDALIPHRAEVH